MKLKKFPVKYWTVYIGERRLRINSVHILVVVVLTCSACLDSVFTTFQFVNSSLHKAIFHRRKEQNEQLLLSLQRMLNNTNSLNAKLDSLITVDNKNRLAWGLDTIDKDLGKLGVGGNKITWSSIGIVDKLAESLHLIQNKSNFVASSFDELGHKISQTEDLLAATPSVWPTQGAVTAGFGWRYFAGQNEFHEGLDIADNIGTPVIATAAGVVTKAEYAGRTGLAIEIDHGYGYKTLYGHLSRAKVELYQRVSRNEIIGYMGNTGRSTGPHLHYEVRTTGKSVPPLNYIIPGATTY